MNSKNITLIFVGVVGLVSLTALAVSFFVADTNPRIQPGLSLVDSEVVLGVFSGVLPCADCSGIETELTLIKSDELTSGGRYILENTYLGHGSEVFIEEGLWVVERGTVHDVDAVVYALYMGDKPSHGRYVRIDENTIQQLDLDGNEVDSNLLYILEKL